MRIKTPEDKGTTAGMRWIDLEDGTKGLYKPDTDGQHFLGEYQYAAIASFFGLPVSMCQQVPGGFISLVSYHPRKQQVEAYDYAPHNALEEFRESVPPHVYDSLLLLAFVDAVTQQADRHTGNIALLANLQGEIVDICPVYDNVACLRNSYSKEAQLTPTSDRVYTHKQVFEWLAKNMTAFDEVATKYASEDFTRLAQCLIDSELLLGIRSELLGLMHDLRIAERQPVVSLV